MRLTLLRSGSQQQFSDRPAEINTGVLACLFVRMYVYWPLLFLCLLCRTDVCHHHHHRPPPPEYPEGRLGCAPAARRVAVLGARLDLCHGGERVRHHRHRYIQYSIYSIYIYTHRLRVFPTTTEMTTLWVIDCTTVCDLIG